ncbi:putative FmdB family regulatory protein [Kushneria sinocarnis]|uniref:Putative FmdB family regulatory protein n=1 Tax=Kushneria sinocarnis TaxID=595502 RepID=A0A420WY63_9GAMM|nr:zinc ribbon domain-containing protein [Kushneria sinocarnis]RKR06167.1 putative FmdB family regulatory protein [Kushneria sinocarnis]
MPIYEYQCQNCGARLEKIQKISASPLTNCPSCREEALERLISPAGFRLSGQGWYETDFKAGNRRNLAGDSGSTSGASGKGGAE